MEFKVSQVQLWQLIMFNLFARFERCRETSPSRFVANPKSLRQVKLKVTQQARLSDPLRCRTGSTWEQYEQGTSQNCVFSFSLVFKWEIFCSALSSFCVLPDPEFATCYVGRRIQKIGQRKFEKEEHERRGAPESAVILVSIDIIDLTMRWIQHTNAGLKIHQASWCSGISVVHMVHMAYHCITGRYRYWAHVQTVLISHSLEASGHGIGSRSRARQSGLEGTYRPYRRIFEPKENWIQVTKCSFVILISFAFNHINPNWIVLNAQFPEFVMKRHKETGPKLTKTL